MKSKSSASLKIGIVAIVAVLLALTLCHKKGPAYKVYFGNLQDSAQVESPFKVEMKAENLVVEPAANGVAEGRGHFHIIIDSPLPPTGEPVPMDSLHLHYGKGQTNTTLDLMEGEHTLTLQFANGNHIPYDPQITQTIHIRVTKRNMPALSADSTKQSVEMETTTMTKTMTTTAANTKSGNTNHVNRAKVDSVPKVSPAIPAYGGGIGTGGGGVGR